MKKKIFSLGLILLGFFVFGNNALAITANITQINFTSLAQTIDANANSEILTIQTQNAENTEEQLDTSGTILNLSSSSTTGEFYDANASACTDLISAPLTLTMRSGSANKHFCYKDSTPGTYTLTVSAEGQTWTPATQEITIREVTPAPTETFIIRNGDTLIYQGTVSLPTETSEQNVLAVLRSIDTSSDSFSISNVQEFSFGSYLKCITPQDGAELCDNWQYAVGNVTPSTSIDTTTLSGGETVGIYFGNSHQVVLSTNSITAGESLTATAQKYNYEDNTWGALTGVSLGVTLLNPDDAWTPIVVSTHPVDSAGGANITIADANTYTLGIAEDFYFPSYTVTVSPAPSGGGGGGGDTPSTIFSAENAIAYLKSVQSADGSFGNSSLYTDWAAIAFGAMDVTDSSRINLLNYLSSHNTLSSLLTDNERRTMALLALGQNPYSFNGINYINAIVESFDGTQFGDSGEDNDDIFAIIPLASAGYTASDNIISKGIAFIISAQNSNGSWDNSVDMTGAAIQALKLFDNLDGAEEAISKAENYIKNAEGNDGGWGNISSTSWAMQAESALNASWSKNGKTGLDYLGTQQSNANNNGAVLSASETPENIIWTTSYAIPAGLGKPWSEIMQSVSKSATENSSNNSGSNSGDDTDDPQTPETPAEPVVCPAGDLFSAVTGQACTAVLQTEPVNLPASNTAVTNTNLLDNSPAVNTKNKKTNTATETPEIVPEIIPDTLTANAINTLPTNKTIPESVPIVLGTVSGLALLYLGLKFLIV